MRPAGSSLHRILSDWLRRERPRPTTPVCDFERLRQQLRPCDVLLLEGTTRMDDRLRRISPGRWSRALLYLGRLHDIASPALRATVREYHPCRPDTPLVLEVRLDRGLVLQPLAQLEAEHLRITRPRELDSREAQEVIRYAVNRMERTRRPSWLDSLRLLLPWGLLPVRWRARFFARIAGNLLRGLTGSVAGEAYSFIQYPVLPLVKRHEDGHLRLYRPQPRAWFAADFDHSPYFDVIKYPFLHSDESRHARLLPWQGNPRIAHLGDEFRGGDTAPAAQQAHQDQ